MTTLAAPDSLADARPGAAPEPARRPAGMWRQVLTNGRVLIGGGTLLAVAVLCLATLPWTTAPVFKDGKEVAKRLYLQQNPELARKSPQERPPQEGVLGWMGYDALGRSILARVLMGGTISLAVGFAAALIAVVLGVSVGVLAGYRGGWVDASLMRSVDILYGLPYVLLVVLFKIAFQPQFVEGITARAIWTMVLLAGSLAGVALAVSRGRGAVRWLLAGAFLVYAFDAVMNLSFWRTVEVVKGEPGPTVWIKTDEQTASVVVLFLAIGLVSWLTMARVVRGQVLSLRGQPFIEACRAMGMRERRIFLRHILPNLIGPITVYATLTVPSAMLQESFLSFLGVGINAPLPSWGNLASEAVEALYPKFHWWLLVFPCTLLAVTLLSLNFMGDGLRDVFDPKKEAAKI